MATLVDTSGIVRFEGTITGAGGTPPQEGYYSGNPVTVTNGNAALVPWDTLTDGTELLDRSAPATPVILVTGWYAVTVKPNGGPSTPGGSVVYGLDLNPTVLSGIGVVAAVNSATFPSSGLCAVTFMDAGGTIQLTAFNDDGMASVAVNLLAAVVVKLA